MVIACAPLLIAWLLQTPAAPAITGTVVDEKQAPLADVEVLLSCGMAIDGAVPVLDRTKTDAQGAFRFALPSSKTRGGLGRFADVWVHRPGLALGAASQYVLEGFDLEPVRVVLRKASKRAVTVLDADGKPPGGAKVEIRAIHFPSARTNMAHEFLPDELSVRLAVTAGKDGSAEFPWIGDRDQFVAARVTLAGLGSYDFQVAGRLSASGQDDTSRLTVTIKPGGSLAGRVEDESGHAAANLPYEIWSKGEDLLASTPVPFSGGPLCTAADGSFRTPPALLHDSEYRVVIRPPGLEPAFSRWVKIQGKETSPPPLITRRLRTMTGRAVDRQGKPVAGVRVFQSGDGPEPTGTTTDAAGHFVLPGFHEGVAFVFARHDGFHFHGQTIDKDASKAELVLSRISEPLRTMKTLPDPIPMEESRALALKVIGPYLDAVLARGDDSAKFLALYAAAVADPLGTLERLPSITFQNELARDRVRGRIAQALVTSDSEEAAAVAESISTPESRSVALVDLVDDLPASERPRKLALLDRALLQTKATKRLFDRVHIMCEVAERWVELGEHDRARSLLAECRKLGEQMTGVVDPVRSYFAIRLAHADLPAALEQVRKIRSKEEASTALINIAGNVAASDPAGCERVLEMIDKMDRTIALVRVCQRMAPVDPARAERLAATARGDEFRVKVLMFLALGLKDRDRNAAMAAFREGIRQLDQGAEQDREIVRNWEMAGLTLVAEQIDPTLVPEIFWRALAARRPYGDPRQETDDTLIAIALFLSRYDREIAAEILKPMVAGLEQVTDGGTGHSALFLALALVDPRRAAALIDRIPITKDLSPNSNWVRIRVAEILASAPAARWRFIWRTHSGLGGLLFAQDIR